MVKVRANIIAKTKDVANLYESAQNLSQVGKVSVTDASNLDKILGEGFAKELEESKLTQKELETDFGKGGSGFATLNRRQKMSTEGHDTAVGRKRQAESIISSGLKTVEDYQKSLKDAQDQEDFFTIYMYGQKNKKWIQDEEVDKMSVSDAVKTAWKQFHIDSDKSYLVSNDRYRDNLIKDGWLYDDDSMTIMKPENSRVLSSKEFNKMVIKAGDNTLTFKNSSVEDVKKRYLESGEYELMRVHPNENSKFTHIIVRSDTALKDLPQFVLPYSPGGNRIYTPRTHFVKIGRTFHEDGGTKFLGYAKTLISGTDIGRLQKYADEVNNAVKIFNNNIDDPVAMQRALDAANFEEFKIKTVEDLKKVMKTEDNPDGFLDTNPDIVNAQVYRGDEKFTYDFGNIKEDYMIIDDLDSYSSELSELAQINRSFYRSKGDEILENINGSYEHIVNPFDIWRQNIMHYANEMMLGEMYRKMGEDFKVKYAKVIAPGININAMGGEEVIRTAYIKAPNSRYSAQAREARRVQATYKALKNMPTIMDEYINDRITDVLKVLPKSWWDNSVVDFLRSQNPADWANAIIFRNYLGFFNIQQIFKNGVLPVINIAVYEPELGFKAMKAAPAVISSYYNRNSKVLKAAAIKASGLTEAELDGFHKYMDDYGTFNQMSQRPEISTRGYMLMHKFPDADLIYLKSATNSVQLVADLTSYLKHGASGDFNRVAGYADDLVGNSNRVNTSALQRSFIGKLVSTFTSYPMSVIETMTGSHFTKQQKWRFALCQFAMWGFGGTLMRDKTTNMYNALDEAGLEEDWIKALLVDGVFTYIFSLMGYDVREGADIGGMFNQMLATVPAIAEMFDVAPDIPTGNAISILGDLYGLVKDAVAPNTNTQDLLSWARATASRSQAPTSVRKLADYIIALDTKQYWDKNGDILIKDVDTAKAFKILLGFTPIEKRLKQMRYEQTRILKTAVDEEFERTVHAIAEKINTYHRTGYGKKELTSDRALEVYNLKKEYQTAVKGFTSWLSEFHPDMLKYGRSLINTDLTAGKDAFADIYLSDYNIDQLNKKRLGVK
jgi:hypothetical protein